MRRNTQIITIIGFFAILAIFSLRSFVLAQTPTATASATATSEAELEDQAAVDQLKEKVAQKVAEMRLKERKALAGFITKISDDLIEIEGDSNETWQVTIDKDLTQIYLIKNGQRLESEKKQLIKGSYIIVSGVEGDKIITANSIYIDDRYLVRSGRVTEIDKEEFSLKLTTVEKEDLTVDIETTTKQYLVDIKTFSLETSGFSKIKEGDTVHIVFKNDELKLPARVEATRILIVPQEYFSI